MERGDWLCNSCGVNNFKIKKECFGCRKPKQQQQEQPAQKQRIGDWDCACGERNFANRTRCRKCPRQRGETILARVHNDWSCSKAECFAVNFEKRVTCFKCNTPKNEVSNPTTTTTTNNPCVVCLENPKTHAIKPCHHLCCCFECGFIMNTCPICRCPYNPDMDLMRIFSV